MDCLIFGERNTTEWIQDVKAERRKDARHNLYIQLTVFLIAFGSLALVGYGIFRFIGPQAMIFLFVLCMVFGGGISTSKNKSSDSSDTSSDLRMFYNVNTGKLEFGFWL